jgi:hypothetical protein
LQYKKLNDLIKPSKGVIMDFKGVSWDIPNRPHLNFESTGQLMSTGEETGWKTMGGTALELSGVDPDHARQIEQGDTTILEQYIVRDEHDSDMPYRLVNDECTAVLVSTSGKSTKNYLPAGRVIFEIENI